MYLQPANGAKHMSTLDIARDLVLVPFDQIYVEAEQSPGVWLGYQPPYGGHHLYDGDLPPIVSVAISKPVATSTIYCSA